MSNYEIKITDVQQQALLNIRDGVSFNLPAPTRDALAKRDLIYLEERDHGHVGVGGLTDLGIAVAKRIDLKESDGQTDMVAELCGFYLEVRRPFGQTKWFLVMRTPYGKPTRQEVWNKEEARNLFERTKKGISALHYLVEAELGLFTSPRIVTLGYKGDSEMTLLEEAEVQHYHEWNSDVHTLTLKVSLKQAILGSFKGRGLDSRSLPSLDVADFLLTLPPGTLAGASDITYTTKDVSVENVKSVIEVLKARMPKEE